MAESDTERVGVRTYVPQYQREAWDHDAEELGMSRAEFIRTMVQAGRRSFDLDTSRSQSDLDPEDTTVQETNPGGDSLEEQLLDILDSSSHSSWDDLVAELTDDIEDRLEERLDDLQRRNRVQYNGRHDGYTLIDDE